MIVDWFLPLADTYFSSGLVDLFFFPLIAVYFISTVPVLIRYLFSWRR